MGIAKEAEACSVTLNHYRNRDTGPGIPLTVVQCITHGVYLTLYPPGHVPYGRKAIVNDLSLDGFQIENETNELSDLFEETLFDGALNGFRGVFHSKEGPYDPVCGCYDTQLNDIKKAALILGVASNDQALGSVHIAEILNLPHLHQSDQFSYFSASSRDYQKAAQSICSLLTQLPTNNRFERLAACGALVDLWPPLHIWYPNTQKLTESTYYRRVKSFKIVSADRASPL